MKTLPLVTLAFATFALGLGELMISGILPAIAADVGVSIPLTGQLVTVYALAFAVLSPPLAIMLRRVNAKSVLIASLALVAVANGLAASAHSFALLLAARVLAAAGSAAATPLAIAAIDRVADEDVRGRAHGIVFTGFSLAATLGVPLGALIATRFGWRPTFACVAGLATCAALGVARTIPTGAPAKALDRAALTNTLARPELRRTLIISTLFLTAQYIAFTYFRPYFAQQSGLDVAQIVGLLFLYGALGIVGTLLGGWAMDRFGTRPALLVSIGGCVIALLSLPLAGRVFAGSIGAVAGWALTAWGFGPLINRQLDHDAGDARDIALALNLTAFNIGIAAGSALGGAAIVFAGIGSVPIIAAAVSLLALIATALRPRRAPANRDADAWRDVTIEGPGA